MFLKGKNRPQASCTINYHEKLIETMGTSPGSGEHRGTFFYSYHDKKHGFEVVVLGHFLYHFGKSTKNNKRIDIYGNLQTITHLRKLHYYLFKKIEDYPPIVKSHIVKPKFFFLYSGNEFSSVYREDII